MVTTIQLTEHVKSELDNLRKEKETYEEIIISLLQSAQESKKRQEELLIEGCKEMYNDTKKINKDWEIVNSSDEWEW